MKIVKNKSGSYTATQTIKNGVSITVTAPSICAAFYSCAKNAKKIKNNLKNSCVFANLNFVVSKEAPLKLNTKDRRYAEITS